MAYNQGLAVGLAIGIPCAIIFVGAYILLMRNKRRNKREDSQGDDLDVELQENNSFNEFQEALHKQYDSRKLPQEPDVDASPSHSEKHPLSAEVASMLRGLGLSQTASDRRKTQLVTPAPLVLNQHQKTPLSYDFYDSFIPIIPDANNTTPTGRSSSPFIAHDLAQPPAINGDRNSVHSSSNTSLVGSNVDSLSRSLDNLAKQLHSPQLFEKLPLRAATMHLKQRPGSHVIAHNLSSDIIHNTLFDRVAINDDYVYESGSPRQKHPYHLRLLQRDSSEFGAGELTVNTTLDTTNIEKNFDNNITADADFDEDTPDVVFK